MIGYSPSPFLRFPPPNVFQELLTAHRETVERRIHRLQLLLNHHLCQTMNSFIKHRVGCMILSQDLGKSLYQCQHIPSKSVRHLREIRGDCRWHNAIYASAYVNLGRSKYLGGNAGVVRSRDPDCPWPPHPMPTHEGVLWEKKNPWANLLWYWSQDGRYIAHPGRCICLIRFTKVQIEVALWWK